MICWQRWSGITRRSAGFSWYSWRRASFGFSYRSPQRYGSQCAFWPVGGIDGILSAQVGLPPLPLRRSSDVAGTCRSALGDYLAGVAAATLRRTDGGQDCLGRRPPQNFSESDLDSRERIGVTGWFRIVMIDAPFAPISSLTVGDLRDWSLLDSTDTATLRPWRRGLTPRWSQRSASKLMRNQDPDPGRTQMHRSHTISEYAWSAPVILLCGYNPIIPLMILLGLPPVCWMARFYGSGDAVVGINLAGDPFDLARLCTYDEIRMQFDILHAEPVLNACHTPDSGDRTRHAHWSGVPIDWRHPTHQWRVRHFPALLKEVPWRRPNKTRYGRKSGDVLRNRSGQCVVGAGHGAWINKREAYGRMPSHGSLIHFCEQWLALSDRNTCDGGKQIIRAGLEDHFCKLLGPPMGEVYNQPCRGRSGWYGYAADTLGAAGEFSSGVPGADDIMPNWSEHLISRRTVSAPGVRP